MTRALRSTIAPRGAPQEGHFLPRPKDAFMALDQRYANLVLAISIGRELRGPGFVDRAGRGAVARVRIEARTEQVSQPISHGLLADCRHEGRIRPATLGKGLAHKLATVGHCPTASDSTPRRPTTKR